MPGARLELAQEFNFPTDFKSVASADSATVPITLLIVRKAPKPSREFPGYSTIYLFCFPLYSLSFSFVHFVFFVFNFSLTI